MKALYKNKNNVQVCNINKPEITSDDDVIIRIKIAGICRTDIYVAQGIVPSNDELVLGHEFSGVIDAIGDNVTHLKIGDRVTVMPALPCGTCSFCKDNQSDICQNTTMLGITRHGGFAEFTKIPARYVYKLPDNVSFKLGAYSEPVAASLSVLKAGLKPEQKGVIYGDNRFGKLLYRILEAHGFEDITLYNPKSGVELTENTYDFAIETVVSEDVINQIFKALKPRGTLVLKSRKHSAVGININQAVMKEITLSAVNYAPFTDVIELLSSGKLNVDDLLGDSYALEDFEKAFTADQQDEKQKSFFNIEEIKCAA